MPDPEKIKPPKDEQFEIRFYEGVITRSPNYIEALIPLAELYTRAGLYDKGLEMDKRLAVLCPEDETVFYNLGCSFALTGHKDQAIEALEKAVALGYYDADHLKKDEDLKSLHDEDAFQRLVSRLERKY